MSDAGVDMGVSGGAAGVPKRPSGAQQRKAKRAKEAAAAWTPTPEEAAKLPPGDEDELAAMRHVMNNQTDRTYQHWNLRRLWQTNPDDFRKEYFGLVRAEKRASRGTTPTSTATSAAGSAPDPALTTSLTLPTDQGTQNIAELLGERWTQYQEFKKYRVEFLEYLPLREAFRQWQEGLGPSRW